MSLEKAYLSGQSAALQTLKLGWPAATHPTVRDSALLQTKSVPDLTPQAKQNLEPPTTSLALSQQFNTNELEKTRLEPRRKLSADLCTSCRKLKHYGTCRNPKTIKKADFNIGMYGGDPSQGNNPSTSPHYHAATSSVSSLARSPDGRPADEQAASMFADLYRHQGIRNSADEPGRMYGGLNKVSNTLPKKIANFLLPGSGGHSMHEQRGPSVNPYEERLTIKSPPVGWGDEGDQRINRSFDQIDQMADSTCIAGGSGTPQPGPLA